MAIEDEKKILQDWVKHPGTKLMARKLQSIAKASIREQLKYDPYTEPDQIMKAKQLRFLLKKTLPDIIEKIVNYKEPVTKPKWSILSLFKGKEG